MFCGQEVGNISGYAPSRGPSEHTNNSLFAKGVARNGSPPWRDDDKDGHYMFAVGENLTSRCNYTLPSLRYLYSYMLWPNTGLFFPDKPAIICLQNSCIFTPLILLIWV